MFKCPMCGEYLDDDAKKCDFCKYEISDTSKKKMIEGRISEAQKAEYEAVMDFQKRGKRSIVILAVGIVVFLIGIAISASVALDFMDKGQDNIGLVIVMGFMVVWAAGFIFALFKNGSNRCPHCARIIHRSGLTAEFCMHCGKRIRYY